MSFEPSIEGRRDLGMGSDLLQEVEIGVLLGPAEPDCVMPQLIEVGRRCWAILVSGYQGSLPSSTARRAAIGSLDSTTA